jgi:multiple sugar transport system substrate-binding protein
LRSFYNFDIVSIKDRSLFEYSLILQNENDMTILKFYQIKRILFDIFYVNCTESNDLKTSRHHDRSTDKKIRKKEKYRELKFLFIPFLILFPLAVFSESLLFISTQLNPVHEANEMRQVILKDYTGDVDFQPYDNRAIFKRFLTDSSKLKHPDLVGGLHGDFVILQREGVLKNLDKVYNQMTNRKFIKSFVNLGKLGQDHLYFIPWMQATYIMAANRKALKYLPKNVDLNTLTYSQLVEWSANIYRETGQMKLGLPLGTKGLIHRFFQGYLYPSYTGSTVSNFRSSEAETMWQEVQQLWKYVNKRSLTFDHMDEPLLSEEVWIAWDHTARVLSAFKKYPKDFIAFPAPAGPKGRGFMAVVSGLGIPKAASDYKKSIALINYLTRTESQLLMLENLGFFPVVETNQQKDTNALTMLKDAVSLQASSGKVVPSSLPIGLGEMSREFNLIYIRTFSNIILRGKTIRPVLQKQSEKLRQIIQKAKAPCWPPDETSMGPCPVK